MIGKRCLVGGRVQGVYYRATAARRARDLGVSGHARNLPDGRVEVLACGDQEAVLAALALLTAAVVPAEPRDVPAPAPETHAPPTEPVAPEPPPAPAAAPPPRVLWFHRHPRRAEAPWVAAANPLAVDAGLEILARGGKAVDAAVAVQALLGLV